MTRQAEQDETGAYVVLMVFLTVVMESLQQEKALPLDETGILWQLYTLLRTLADPERKRPICEALVKNLPAKVQREILREVRRLRDPGAVMLADALKSARLVKAV